MPGNKPKQAPQFDHNSAVHQPFSWLDAAAKTYPMADFVALIVNVGNGLHTCLEIVNSSNLERISNEDAVHGEEVTPAVDVCDAEKLMRFAIATTQLLREAAEERISWINEHVAARLEAMKDDAE